MVSTLTTGLATGLCVTPTCQANQMFQSWAAQLSEFAWSLLQGSFTGEASRIDSAEFSIAAVMTNRFAGVMAFVLVVVGCVQVVRDVQKDGIGASMRTVLAVLLAWPITAFSVWATMKLTVYLDLLTNAILSTGEGTGALNKLMTPILQVNSATGPISGATAVLVFIAIVWLISLFLSIVMVLRNFGILALIGFAPVALMMFPAEVTKGWTKNWMKAVLVALLIKPASAALIVLAAALVEGATGVTALLTGLVGLILALCSPLFLSKVLSFVDMGSADATTQAASGAGRSAMNTAYRTGRSMQDAGRRKSGNMSKNMNSSNPSGAGSSGSPGGNRAPHTRQAATDYARSGGQGAQSGQSPSAGSSSSSGGSAGSRGAASAVGAGRGAAQNGPSGQRNSAGSGGGMGAPRVSDAGAAGSGSGAVTPGVSAGGIASGVGKQGRDLFSQAEQAAQMPGAGGGSGAGRAAFQDAASPYGSSSSGGSSSGAGVPSRGGAESDGRGNARSEDQAATAAQIPGMLPTAAGRIRVSQRTTVATRETHNLFPTTTRKG